MRFSAFSCFSLRSLYVKDDSFVPSNSATTSLHPAIIGTAASAATILMVAERGFSEIESLGQVADFDKKHRSPSSNNLLHAVQDNTNALLTDSVWAELKPTSLPPSRFATGTRMTLPCSPLW